MKKNILIISYSYPPSNVPAAQRPYAVAKYIDKEKFDVTVITCKNPDQFWGTNEGFESDLPSVKLIKINSLLGSGGSIFRKSKTDNKKSFKNKIKSTLSKIILPIVIPDKAIFWYPNVRSYIRNNEDLIKKSNIIFTSSPSFSNHLIGKFIKSKNKEIIWVSELRDFHFIETTKKVRNLKQLFNKKLEHSVIKKSDLVSFISNSMHSIYSHYFPEFKHKFRVIYNGFDTSDFESLNVVKTNNKKLIIFYAGSFYRGIRSPVHLLKILDILIEKGKISSSKVEIRIAGNFENELKDEIKCFKSFHSINFLGNIPRSKVLESLVSSDLLWLIVANKSTHYTGVPIKFFEYLGARRPIINFAPDASETTKFISEKDLGWNFDITNFDLNTSVEVFEKIITKHKSGLLQVPINYKFHKEFDREFQGQLFEKLFDEK